MGATDNREYTLFSTKYWTLRIASSSRRLVNRRLIYIGKSTNGDYHDEMNSEKFVGWHRGQLIPNLSPKSVVVIDNALYHSVQKVKCPTQWSRKADIQAWLNQQCSVVQRRGVSYVGRTDHSRHILFTRFLSKMNILRSSCPLIMRNSIQLS